MSDTTAASVGGQQTPPQQVGQTTSSRLTGDIDAAGYRIENASLVQTEELIVKNTPFTAWLSELTKSLQDWATGLFAKKDHGHPQFAELEKRVMTEIERKQDKGDYAEVGHTHPEHIHELRIIERGGEIRELLNHVTDLCPRQHAHPKTDAAILEIRGTLEKMQDALDEKAKKESVSEIRDFVKDFARQFDADLSRIEKSIPTVPKEELEIIASRYCLIPRKCHGKAIAEISAVALNGSKLGEVDVNRSGKRVKVGTSVATDDLLTFPPNCLVRLRFS